MRKSPFWGRKGQETMRIILAGAGKVGQTLAENLTGEEQDVVIIDIHQEVLQTCEDNLDVLCVQGNCANAQTLIEAGVDRADILIATTASDEINMLCCLIGKKLGARYTIARIRDPQYNESLLLLQEELGIDMAINPERATALEISRLLRYPFASEIEPFAKGHVEMVAFQVKDGDAFVDMPLKEIGLRMRDMPKVLFAAVERDGSITIPGGDFILRRGDRVFVDGDIATVTHFFRYIGRNTGRIRNVMIIGGGKICYYLSKLIMPLGMHVTIIENNPQTAAKLSETLPGANVLLGDGTSQDLLEEVGVRQMDAVICATGRDEENLMAGMYISQLGPKVIVKNNRLNYDKLIRAMGLESVVSPRHITSASILRYIRARIARTGTTAEKLYRLMGGKAEAIEFVARPEDPYIGVALKDLHMRKNSQVSVIVRKGKVIVPFGSDHIEAGDNVLITVVGSGISDLNEVIRR